MSDDAPRGDPGVDPDDLDISKSEYVRELGDDRYVVSPGRRPPRVPPETDTAEDAGGEDSTRGDAGDAGAEASAANRTGGSGDAAGGPPTESMPSADDVREGLSPEDAQRSSSRTARSATSDSSSGHRGATEPSGGPAGSDDGLPTDPMAGGEGGPDDASAAARAGDASTADRTAARASDRPASHGRRGAPRGGGDANGPPADLDAGAVGQWLAASLADSEFAYGFDATLSLDGRTARHRMASDDVGETFETLVTWFADAAGGDTPTEDALGILLAGMDQGPRLPPNAVRAALAGLGLSRDDSVEDLLTALDRAGGLQLK